jgi:hypothetical protein
MDATRGSFDQLVIAELVDPRGSEERAQRCLLECVWKRAGAALKTSEGEKALGSRNGTLTES